MTDAAIDKTSPRSRKAPSRSLLLVPGIALVIILTAVILGPLLTPDANHQDLMQTRLPVGSPGHLLGTDALGRDVLARALDGGRVSLVVGISTVLIGAGVGGSLGIIAGYLGGKVDMIISRVTEIMLAFPSLIIALAIATFLGPSVRNIVFAICFHTIPAFIRLSRANTIRLRRSDFIVAAKVAGGRTLYIMSTHLIPLISQSLVAYGLLAMGTAIIIESSLSFLGLGVRPPQATWGTMLADGRSELAFAPHLALVPAAMLFITVLTLNLCGEALRTRADRKVGAA